MGSSNEFIYITMNYVMQLLPLLVAVVATVVYPKLLKVGGGARAGRLGGGQTGQQAMSITTSAGWPAAGDSAVGWRRLQALAVGAGASRRQEAAGVGATAARRRGGSDTPPHFACCPHTRSAPGAITPQM
jgi:hypothetical protein